MDTLCLQSGISGIAPSISIAAASRANDYAPPKSKLATAALRRDKPSLFSRFSFRYQSPLAAEPGGKEEQEQEQEEEQNGNWVFNIFRVNSVWGRERSNPVDDGEKDEVVMNNGDQIQTDKEEEEECCVGCTCSVDDDEQEEVRFDRESFSRMLRRVSLSEARWYAQMSYLGNLSYSIPEIKPGNLLKKHGLRFVTSSIEKRESATTAGKNQASAAVQKEESGGKDDAGGTKEQKNDGSKISAAAAYEIAASAASYLHAQTKNILPFKSSNAVDGEGSLEATNESAESVKARETEVESLRTTTDSVTAVVAANEEVKQAFADDLNSTSSSPCEWFTCDDDQSSTRYFVIQGSESFASWQANLLFEPVQFEGLDVLVHRGIYEAAKGTYQQMLPEVHAHLKSRGSCATFRFTGHSLGGSLALLVNLMLLIRKEVPISSLLPVITFGSPSIMCGGDSLLDKLGLPRSHVQAITMHRDIVPRAFSCQYPTHVAELLKAVNGSFRGHPCLNNLKLLYAPMGELLILQPDEKFSPSHDLLPSGCGLYLLSGAMLESLDRDEQLRAAKLVFLNSPHPLEILSERCAYGSGGTIQRDHDMNSYFKSVRAVIRQQLNQIRKIKREQRRKVWWPLVLLRGSDSNIVVRRSTASVNMVQDQPSFSGIIQTGVESP